MKKALTFYLVLWIFLSFILSNCGNATEQSFTDQRDGQVYTYKKIGKYNWMTVNLNFDSGEGAFKMDADEDTTIVYGRMYTFEAAHKAIPEGWHMPSEAEWNDLISHLGGIEVAGGKMKQEGTNLWQSPNEGATNESGFSATPGGEFGDMGNWQGEGYVSAFWISDLEKYDLRQAIVLNNNSVTVSIQSRLEAFLRCVKNE